LTPPIPEIAAEYWIIVNRDLRRALRAAIDRVKGAVWRTAGRTRWRLGRNLSAHGRSNGTYQGRVTSPATNSAVAGNVGGEDRGQFALYRMDGHPRLLPIRV
jgi:hypothetical protein